MVHRDIEHTEHIVVDKELFIGHILLKNPNRNLPLADDMGNSIPVGTDVFHHTVKMEL